VQLVAVAVQLRHSEEPQLQHFVPSQHSLLQPLQQQQQYSYQSQLMEDALVEAQAVGEIVCRIC